WGWKDPRTSLTIPLWLELVPDLRVVVCLRNPLDVALSLRKRGMFSYSSSLLLWLEYNERLLDGVPAKQLLVTDYDTYFPEPKAGTPGGRRTTRANALDVQVLNRRVHELETELKQKAKRLADAEERASSAEQSRVLAERRELDLHRETLPMFEKRLEVTDERLA